MVIHTAWFTRDCENTKISSFCWQLSVSTYMHCITMSQS